MNSYDKLLLLEDALQEELKDYWHQEVMEGTFEEAIPVLLKNLRAVHKELGWPFSSRS